MASAQQYEWISESALSEAACITVVAGGDADAVLRGFGVDPAASVDVADVDFDSLLEGGWVAAVAVPGGVVAVEDNGFQGSLPEVLIRASSGAVAASMFWNVNADNAFTCVRDGQLVATVDMYEAEDPDDVDLPANLRPLFDEAADEEADLWAIGLAMVETFTGVTVSPEILAAARTVYRIPGY